MRRSVPFPAAVLAAVLLGLGPYALLGARAAQQPPERQVVDRIVARIEDDIITLSELRELGRFQQLAGDRRAGDHRLLAHLIEQWIIQTEATAARFPRPSSAEVDGELERLRKQLGSPEVYAERLRQYGLSVAAVRRLVERQLYLTRYVDYKFRPAVQVGAAEIEKYYGEELLPQLAARGQAPPKLEAVEEQVRELLTQRGISERAVRWLEETRSRLKIELELAGDGS